MVRYFWRNQWNAWTECSHEEWEEWLDWMDNFPRPAEEAGLRVVIIIERKPGLKIAA